LLPLIGRDAALSRLGAES